METAFSMKGYDTSRNRKNQDSSLLFCISPCPKRISDDSTEIQIQPLLALGTWSEPSPGTQSLVGATGTVERSSDRKQNASMHLALP